MPVTRMGTEHVQTVACLHASGLAGVFLPSLGENFLRVFYRTALRHQLAFGFVWCEADRPVGFVLGSENSSRLFWSAIARSTFSLGWAAFPAVLRRPGLLLKVVETFLYPRRAAAVLDQAELLVISIDAARRGQGIGEALVQALNTAFREQGVKSYKVTVLQSNKGANLFYQRLGFKSVGEFQLYQQGWNIYRFLLDG